MALEFVAIDADGKEFEWIDPLVKLQVEEHSVSVSNDVDTYEIVRDASCTYVIRERK